MTLADRIQEDYKQAFKARRQLEISTLRLIKAAIQKKAIDAKTESLDDVSVISVLNSQAKQRRETLDSAAQTGRDDVVEETKQELAVIERYLPAPLTEPELDALIDAAITEHGRNMGLIMKQVLSRAEGRADGKLVSRRVNEKLKAE